MTVTPIRAATERESWLTKRQLADRLGVSVSWIDLRRREGMPCHKWAGIVRFRMSEVERWLAEAIEQRRRQAVVKS